MSAKETWHGTDEETKGTYNADLSFVVLYADDEIVEKIKKYGKLQEYENTSKKYNMYVDPRYDFDEVVVYQRINWIRIEYE